MSALFKSITRTEVSTDLNQEPPISIAVSVIITTYHDEPAIPALAREIETALNASGIAWEAIWINDGSPDNTQTCLDALSPPHRTVHFARNIGQAAGYRAGAEAARGVWIATLDGDGPNDPADIPRLLAHAKKHDADFVNGIRASRCDPWLRCWSARVAGVIRNIATGIRITDAGCASRIINRALFLRIPFFNGNFYFLAPFAIRLGGVYKEIPVNHRPRLHGQPHYGISNRIIPGITNLLGACWLLRRQACWWTLADANSHNNIASNDEAKLTAHRIAVEETAALS